MVALVVSCLPCTLRDYRFSLLDETSRENLILAVGLLGLLGLEILKYKALSLTLLLFLGCAVISDVYYRVIPNRLVLSTLLLGLLTNIVSRPNGLVYTLSGMAIGFSITFLLYLFGSIAGGDVKLVAAVGTLTGPLFVSGMLGWTLLFSSGFGILYMLVSGRFLEMLRFTYDYLKYLLYKIARRDYSKEPLAKADVTFPYAVFVLLGCIAEILFPGVMVKCFTDLLSVLDMINEGL